LTLGTRLDRPTLDREPAESTPVIRGWWPIGWTPRFDTREVLYWHGDLFWTPAASAAVG
jgi:hypothetical protein